MAENYNTQTDTYVLNLERLLKIVFFAREHDVGM